MRFNSPRLAIRAVLATLAALLIFGAIPAGAQTTATTVVTSPSASDAPGRVRVIEVSGYIDPIMADFMTQAVHSSENNGDEVLVIQFDSHGTLLSHQQMTKLQNTIRDSRIPVAIWVGGIGARATNGTFPIVQAADIVGVAPAIALGPRHQEMTAAQALQRGDAQIPAAVLQLFVFQLDGKVVHGQTLHTADRNAIAQKARVIKSPIAFKKPSLLARFLHASSSPSIAYLFLIIGLLLVVFEFFSVGVGIAAVSGLILLLPSAYGLGVLPTNAWAVGLVMASVLAYSVDIQAGATRAWTVIGTILFIVGSLNMYNGLSLPLFTFVPVLLLTLVFVFTGMPSTIRARFSLPVVGREWMLGEIGTAKSEVSPDGTIDLRGGSWPARTNRSTPISVGARVRIVGLEGGVLEVEPEEGGAKDAHH